MEERVWHRQYDPDVSRSIDYDEIVIPDILARTAQKFPDANALFFLNCTLTYRQLKEEVDKAAAAFASLGVKSGSCVAVHLPNLPQTVIAYYGALTLGARVVLTNPLYTAREIEHQWTDAGCEMAVTADFLWDQVVRAARGKLPVKNYVIASIPEYLRFPLNLLAPLKLKKQDPARYAKVAPGPGVHLFKKFIHQNHPQPARATIGWEDVAVLQYTGGTTGVSKGAMLTHKNLSVNVQQVSAWFTAVEHGKEVVLTALPIFHVFGMTVAMNWGISVGAALSLMPNPRDLDMLVKNVSKHRVTLFPSVPALFNGLNNYPGIEKIDVSSVKSCFSGSAPIPDDVLEKFERLTSSRIIEGFGMTETSPVTHCNPLRGTRKIGKVGVPVPDTDARVVDIETGQKEMPVGEEGELVLRGPQVMQGYWQRPDETAKTIKDGWLFTGDLAVMDEDGFFQIVGRKKDMINCSGFKVFPDEVDNVLMSHDKILEAATIGIPDPERGETVKSFIVMQPGQTMSQDEIVAFCSDQLAKYKIPRQIEFLNELPKSSVLKVLRRELRDREIAKQAAGANS